jgi:PBSX family phage portal protein
MAKAIPPDEQGGDGRAGSAASGGPASGSGVGVSVVTPEGIRKDVGGMPSGGGASAESGRAVLEKESEQEPDRGGRLSYVEPDIPFEDLLLFHDHNLWHRRCVALKSYLVGSLGWQLERSGEAGASGGSARTGGDRASGGAAADLLDDPNPSVLETFEEIINRFLTDYFALGNGYLEIVRDRSGDVAELYHAPARTMRRAGEKNGYWQVKERRETRFARFGRLDEDEGESEILHLYQYDPSDDYYGVPGWYGALRQMALEQNLMEFNTNLFANGLMAHLALIVEGGTLDDDGRAAVREFVSERMTGPENAGNILLLENENDGVELKFEDLNLDVENLLATDPLEYVRDSVLSAHGVPPRLVGVATPGRLGGSNEVQGQLRTFRETVLRPTKRRLETVLNALLAQVEEGVTIHFADMDVTGRAADADFYETMIQQGVFTAEEVRERFDTGREK